MLVLLLRLLVRVQVHVLMLLHVLLLLLLTEAAGVIGGVLAVSVSRRISVSQHGS